MGGMYYLISVQYLQASTFFAMKVGKQRILAWRPEEQDPQIKSLWYFKSFSSFLRQQFSDLCELVDVSAPESVA